jgi:plasmid stabilization system protein ParE
MGEKEKEQAENSIAAYSEAAKNDLAAIYFKTLFDWGVDQAEAYAAFIRDRANAALEGSPVVRRLDSSIDVYFISAYWKNASQGHNIFFRHTEQGIAVIRILHSSMNSSEHFDA